MLAEAIDDDRMNEIFSYQSIYGYEEETSETDPLKVFKASSDPDTMYHHEAMKAPDRKQFIKAMVKEINDQEGHNWEVVRRSEVPEGATVLNSVWQMKRKRDIKSRKVKKWKARLNIDGSKMIKGKHYEQNYAPVASWNSIRTMLALTAVNNWHTTQIDYVLAFPQAPVEGEFYMKIPGGFKIDQGKSKDFLLKLKRNHYSTKHAGWV